MGGFAQFSKLERDAAVVELNMRLVRFILVRTAGGMTLCKADLGALRPTKKLCAGHRTLPPDFLPTRHIAAFLFSHFIEVTLHSTVKMSKPFNPEEAENLEDVRTRVQMERLKNLDR